MLVTDSTEITVCSCRGKLSSLCVPWMGKDPFKQLPLFLPKANVIKIKHGGENTASQNFIHGGKPLRLLDQKQ